MTKIGGITSLVFAASLFSFALNASAEPAKPTVADVLDFCAAAAPSDATKKAEDLRWNRIEGQNLEKWTKILVPLPDRPHDVQAWQQGMNEDMGILAYAYDQQSGDGSFMSMLKSFAAKPHSCAYLGTDDAAALKAAMTERLGPATDETDADVSAWDGSSVIAYLRKLPQSSAPHTVALTMIYK